MANQIYTAVEVEQVCPVCILGWSFVMGLQSHFLLEDLAYSYASHEKTIFVSRVQKIMLVMYRT